MRAILAVVKAKGQQRVRSAKQKQIVIEKTGDGNEERSREKRRTQIGRESREVTLCRPSSRIVKKKTQDPA